MSGMRLSDAPPRGRPTAGIAAVAVAGLAGLAWGGPIMARMINDSDFPFHIETAKSFAATGHITMPHFLLQVLLGSVVASGVASAQQAALIFFQAIYVVTAALVCWYIIRWAGAARPVLAVLLAVAVLMSAPITTRGELDMYLIGYFPPNAYHNPTMLLARPLLVLALASAVVAVTRVGPLSVRELIALTAPVVFLGFAKPNYLACLAPALGLAAIWKNLRATGRPTGAVSWVRVAAVCGAAVCTVGGMLVLYRALALGQRGGVTFAPFAVIGHHAEVDALFIARSVAGSLAFPIGVTLLWPRAVWGDPGMRIAWAGMIVGLLISYLLAEEGDRSYDGNFLWTGQMAVFVLFVAAAAFLTRVTTPRPDAATLARGLGVMAVLWLHVESGIRHVTLKMDASGWLAFWT
jgi:hypothetical protein